MSTKPEAGQWWFNCTTFGCDAKRNGVRIQDVLSDTQVLIEGVQGCWEVWPRDELSGGWHHEPRCTGWDWVVPQPAEDPDEWVVQDGVPPRRGKDQFRSQKTRVRLWIEGPTKMVMCRDKAPYGDWQELHHDSDGFYVENQR